MRHTLPFILASACIVVSCEKPESTTTIVTRVNEHWQQEHAEHNRAFWDEAVYHTGNVEIARTMQRNDWLQYSTDWAEHNNWCGATSNDTANWQYRTYGESPDFVLFGDWQTCFQVYLDLHRIAPDVRRTERAYAVIDHQILLPQHDFWWWCDALYMVMPVMSKMYTLTGNELYLNKLYEYFSFTDSIMWDADAGLYYRDAKYVFPEHKTESGAKDFWARGDGWVFAALAKVLNDIPEDAVGRDVYLERYRTMAQSVAACQTDDGYWTRSMLDNAQAPGPETSGTALFAFGYMWGVNNGILDYDEYKTTIEKAWNYLAYSAVQPDGTVGYVQPIGERAIPGQVVDAQSTANFGVGAFLLAASERIKYENISH